MHIDDLTGAFIELVLESGDGSRYEATFPELFEHYFRYFCPRRDYPTALSAAEVKEKTDRLRRRIPDLERRFIQAGLGLDKIEAVLFVGQGASNGHAFPQGDGIIVWLPVETYSSDSSIDVFVTHEIVHALHYRDSPGFTFDDSQGKNHLARQLITEGLATLLTGEILCVDDTAALWADCVPRDWALNWERKRRVRLSEVAVHALPRLDSSPEDNSFFWYTGQEDEDIYRNRTGYLLGMELLRVVCRRERLATANLLRIQRPEMERFGRTALEEMASGPVQGDSPGA